MTRFAKNLAAEDWLLFAVLLLPITTVIIGGGSGIGVYYLGASTLFMGASLVVGVIGRGFPSDDPRLKTYWKGSITLAAVALALAVAAFFAQI